MLSFLIEAVRFSILHNYGYVRQIGVVVGVIGL